jgi:hypothetical protein
MNQSERIKLISEIADKLTDEEWSLIDLTLRQFGLPWTDAWNDNSRRGYVMSMIEDAGDQTLLDLASHLGLEHSDNSNEISISTSKVNELIKEIELQKGLMISVATGGPRIQNVNEEYKNRRLLIMSTLQAIGIEDPNPFGDLWDWYGKWSDGSLPTYQSRRSYIASFFQPLINRFMLLAQRKSIVTVKPTGWTRVDRNIEKIIQSLGTAINEEDFQAVGLLCREAIISLAQAVYDPESHQSLDGIDPSETDAKRMLESYIATELAGGSNEELRRYSKNAYKLAVVLQHKRNACFREAALCVEATRSIINIIAVVSGQRDP